MSQPFVVLSPDTLPQEVTGHTKNRSSTKASLLAAAFIKEAAGFLKCISWQIYEQSAHAKGGVIGVKLLRPPSSVFRPQEHEQQKSVPPKQKFSAVSARLHIVEHYAEDGISDS